MGGEGRWAVVVFKKKGRRWWGALSMVMVFEKKGRRWWAALSMVMADRQWEVMGITVGGIDDRDD